MKAPTLFAMGLLALALPSRADVLIYKQKVTVTQTGAGPSQKISFTGWFITDPVSGDAALVKVYGAQKRFHIDYGLSSITGTISEAKGATSTVYLIQSDDPGTVAAKGVNAKTVPPEGSTRAWLTPLAMTISGTTLQRNFANGRVNEWKGSLLYDQSDTVKANGNALTVEDVAHSLRLTLLDQGNVEE